MLSELFIERCVMKIVFMNCKKKLLIQREKKYFMHAQPHHSCHKIKQTFSVLHFCIYKVLLIKKRIGSNLEPSPLLKRPFHAFTVVNKMVFYLGLCANGVCPSFLNGFYALLTSLRHLFTLRCGQVLAWLHRCAILSETPCS